MFSIYKKDQSNYKITDLSFVALINDLEHVKENIYCNNFSPELFYIELICSLINNIDVTLYDNKIIEKSHTKIENSITLLDVEDLTARIMNSKSSLTLFTSGTTGNPKRIKHTVKRFIEMCRVQEDRNIVWALLYNPSHMAGLQVFFQSFINKNKLVYLFETSKMVLLKACEAEKITHISATPTFYRLLAPYDFVVPTIVRCTLGGEKSDSKLLENLKNVFVNAKMNNIYASTEAGSIFISKGEFFEVLPKLKDKVKFVENEIVLHHTLIGEFDKEKWFYTGDLVEFIDDKKFVIISRKSDFVNIGGNRVNILEVEQVIRNLSQVINVSISTQDNSVLGKILIANVVLNIELTKKEFKNLIKPKLAHYKIPTKINFVEKLKMAKSGKLIRT